MKNIIIFLLLVSFLTTSSLMTAQCLVCSNGTNQTCIASVAAADATDSTCVANFGATFSKLEYSTDDCETINGCNDPLPVELTYFKVFETTKKEAGIVLEWQTATELNNQGFEIERSSFGQDWQYLITVAGNGITTQPTTYSWIDDDPAQGINYYRLKQIDTDSTFTYSNVVSIEITNNEPDVQLFPNPVGEVLFLNSGSGKAILYNTYGQRIGYYTLQEGTSQLNVTSLTPGAYILEVQLDSKSLITLRFIK